MCEDLLSPSSSLGLVRTSLTRYVLGSITSDLGLEEGLTACRFTRQCVTVTFMVYKGFCLIGMRYISVHISVYSYESMHSTSTLSSLVHTLTVEQNLAYPLTCK